MPKSWRQVDNSVQRIWCLTDLDLQPGQENSRGFIVVTMTHNESKFLRWTSSGRREDGGLWAGELVIDDYTQTFESLLGSEATLATSLTAIGILQVTPSGVYVTDKVFRQFSPHSRIIHASVVDSDIALVIYNETGYWSLLHMQLEQVDGVFRFSIRESVVLPREPSAVKLSINKNNHLSRLLNNDAPYESKICLLAFRFPRKVVMYQLHNEIDPTILGECALDPELSQDVPDDPRASEVNSIDLLCDSVTTIIYLGLRHGMVMSIDITNGFETLSLQNTKFGHSPVEFISTTHTKNESENTSLFVMCEYLWEIRLKNGELELHEVLFDDFRIVLPPRCRSNYSRGYYRGVYRSGRGS